MTDKEKIEALKKIYVSECMEVECSSSTCPFREGTCCLLRKIDGKVGLKMTDEKRKLIVSILNDLDDEYQYWFNPLVPEKIIKGDKCDSIACVSDETLYDYLNGVKKACVIEKSTNKLVYIASPYTKGDNFVNTQRQITTAIELLKHSGIVPFCPLLNSVFVNMQHEFSYDKWLEVDFTYLSKCDYLLRLSGESSGADKEVAYAKEHGIPVFYDIDSLIMAIKGGSVD